MTKDECLDFFGITDLMDLPGAVGRLISMPLAARDRRYVDLLRINNYDMGIDWFQQIYEQELSQRKQHGQDFTSMEVAQVLAEIAGVNGSVHEPTAGNGGLLIRAWHVAMNKVLPWEWYPSQHMVTCWELSDRSIPLLLLNLSIRGIMGYVYHGDVLENSVKARYVLLNRHDDALGFSEIIKTNDMIVRV